KNAIEKIDEFRLGQALERGGISPAIFKKQHAELVRTGKLGPGAKPGTLKQRTLPLTFGEALEQGWEPLSWNAVDLISLHAAELADFRYSHVLGELWKMEGRAIPRSAAPTSWRTPQYPAFQGRPFVDSQGLAKMSEPLAVSPEDMKLLENMLGTRPSSFTDAAAYVTSVFKRSKVFLSFFQHGDLTMRSAVRSLSRGELWAIPAASRALAANFIPPLRQRFTAALMREPVVKEMVEEGLQLPRGLDIFKRELRTAMEPDLVVRFPVIGDLPLDRLPPGLRQASKPVQKLLNNTYEYFAGGLFDGAGPQYMAAFGKSVRKELAKAHPELSSRQLSALAAQHTNIMMSNIPEWASVLGPRWRQLARGVMFSVNENEAWLRQMTALAIKGKTPGARGLYLRQWAGYILGLLAFSELVNYAITGELMPKEQMMPLTFKKKNGIYFPTGYNSRFARPRLDGDGPLGRLLGIQGGQIFDENGQPTGDTRHIYLDLLGQADTPFRMLSPEFFVMTRLAPQWATGAQVYKGERFFGEQPIEGFGETAGFAAQQLVEPIGISGFLGEERSRIGGTGAAIQAVGGNVSAEGLRDVLARIRAQVMQEKGLTGAYEMLNDLQRPKVDSDPRVQAVFNEVQKSTAKMAPTPEGQFFDEVEASRGQQETE
ncbi:hypothetical protein LCGC14_2140050, partial [marine sediment metagenome]